MNVMTSNKTINWYGRDVKSLEMKAFFNIVHGNNSRQLVNSNWISSHVKNKSVKLPFVTKNSKHLVGTSGDDLSALI